MTPQIPSPAKGQPMRASWAAQVTDVCNAVRAAGFAGTMVRDGAGALGNAPLPENKRNRSRVYDCSCWKVVSGTRDETVESVTTSEPVRLFENQFYLDGEYNLHELELDDAVEDFVCQGELAAGQEYTSGDLPYVCLKIPAAADSTAEAVMIGYANLVELQAAQKDFAFVVRPLYKFTHDGRIAVDFRNCPSLQVAEVPR